MYVIAGEGSGIKVKASNVDTTLLTSENGSNIEYNGDTSLSKLFINTEKYGRVSYSGIDKQCIFGTSVEKNNDGTGQIIEK